MVLEVLAVGWNAFSLVVLDVVNVMMTSKHLVSLVSMAVFDFFDCLVYVNRLAFYPNVCLDEHNTLNQFYINHSW